LATKKIYEVHVGDRSGFLEVIKDRVRISGSWRFLCRCKCGKESYYKQYQIKGPDENKLVKSCPACFIDRYSPPEDEIGKIYRKWKIVSYLGITKGKRRFTCQCIKCDKTRDIAIQHLREGYKKNIRCTECNKYKSETKEAVINRLWVTLKDRVARRNLEIDIDKDFLIELFDKQKGLCYLSGIQLNLSNNLKEHNAGLTTASIDRIDSNKGYLRTNVAWCHKHINQMKMNLLNEDFINWCKLIAAHNLTIKGRPATRVKKTKKNFIVHNPIDSTTAGTLEGLI